MNALAIYQALVRLPNLPVCFTPAGAGESYEVTHLEHGEDGIALECSGNGAGMLSQEVLSWIAEYAPNADIVVNVPAYGVEKAEVLKVQLQEGWIELLG